MKITPEMANAVLAIVERSVHYCHSAHVPFSYDEVGRCLDTLTDLQGKIGSNGQHVLIFEAIVQRQLTKNVPWTRIERELVFEIIVSVLADRYKAASMQLDRHSKQENFNDEDLDAYNERIKRFEGYFCERGHPVVDEAGRPVLLSSE